MITEIQAAHALQTAIVAILGITVLFKIVPMFRLDCFRQQMFSVRDELFDYATAGNIAFSDPAYILLRRQMNGMIRYGHQLTLFRSVMTWTIKRVSGNKPTFPWHESWDEALANLKSDEVRSQMQAFHNRGATIAAKHLIYGSMVLWIALMIAAICLFTFGATLGIRQLLRLAKQKVLSGPIDQRFIEEDAVGGMA